MKTCPYCAEEIQDAAVVCRFCQRSVVPPSPEEVAAAQAQAANASFLRGISALLSLLAVGLTVWVVLTMVDPRIGVAAQRWSCEQIQRGTFREVVHGSGVYRCVPRLGGP
jgi:hypothetical protein